MFHLIVFIIYKVNEKARAIPSLMVHGPPFSQDVSMLHYRIRQLPLKHLKNTSRAITLSGQ